MSDSIIHESAIQNVSHYESPNWKFECTSWQYDRILERLEFDRQPGKTYKICGDNLEKGPADIVMIQFRYRSGGSCGLFMYFWIRKAYVDADMSFFDRDLQLSKLLLSLNPELSYVKRELSREVIHIAQTLLNMPSNAGREGLSFVYEISAYPTPTIAPAPAASSSMITTFKFSASSDPPPLCVICLGEISDGHDVSWMPCSHVYHHQCISLWLQRKKLCPVCRLVLDQPYVNAVN